MRITVNEALGYLREHSVSQVREVVMEEIPDIEDMAMDDLDEIPQRVLLQFIQELPPGYRTVFNLYVMEEKALPRNGRCWAISGTRDWLWTASPEKRL